MNPITQFFLDILNGILQGLIGPVQPLIALIGTTPLAYTTANPLVLLGWHTMTAASDSALGLFALVGLIHLLYGQSTGSPYVPLGVFVPRLLLTAIFMHLSELFGQDLILLNNLLCDLVSANVRDFVLSVTAGQGLGVAQQAVLGAILGAVFLFGLIRVLFQAAKRIVFLNVLFVFSAPAILLSLLPQTQAWFAYWSRTFVTTVFTQFLQFATFGLGIQFLLDTKQTGLTGFLLAIAMLYLVAEIPGLLARFSASAGANTGGLGSLVGTAIVAARLLV